MPLLASMLGQARSGGAALYSPGTLLNNGRYKIDKRLNKGATAIVYAATDKQTGHQVALKVVQCGSNKVPVSVVRREVTLSSSVAHENMVQLLDVFAEGTELIIVWELIAGPDLLELLNEAHGRMNEPAAAFYFVQLLRGVLHMHAMGYCHRDIKPENCMVERATQRLKLIDFGLSKHLESVATLGVGTPDYMPPEMVRSQVKAQQRSQQMRAAAAAAGPASLLPHGGKAPPYDAKKVDAWAMGVLLYLLVTGTYPFEDPSQPNNLAATIMNVQAGRCRPLPPAISQGCRAVIAGLLNPNPETRTRLEDLATCDWLAHSAAAHAAQLAHLTSRFDPTNPSWILPSQHAVNASAAASPSTFAEDQMGTAGLPARGTAAAAAAAVPHPAPAAAAAGGLQLSGPSSSMAPAAGTAASHHTLAAEKQQLHQNHQHNHQQIDACSDTTEFMDADEGPLTNTTAAPALGGGIGGNGGTAAYRSTLGIYPLAAEPAGSPAAAAAAAGGSASGGGVALSFLTAAMGGSSESFSNQMRNAAAAAGNDASTAAAGGGGGRVQHGAAGGGGGMPGAAGAAAGGSRKGMGWLPEFMRRCI